jgi:hypothetical protein
MGVYVTVLIANNEIKADIGESGQRRLLWC